MNNILLINIILSFILFLIALMFIEGIWHKKGKLVKAGLDIDNLFFPKLKDKRILKAGDQLAFLICILMSLCTLINGLLSLIFPSIENISGIFVFVTIILVWPIRILFIFLNRNKKDEEVSMIWPFPK